MISWYVSLKTVLRFLNNIMLIQKQIQRLQIIFSKILEKQDWIEIGR